MIYLKSPSQIEKLEEVNRIGRLALKHMYNYIQPGVKASELEFLSRIVCQGNGAVSAFYNYRGYPYHTCVSVNDEIIHGLPTDRIFKAGDIVSVDFGVIKDGYVSDSAFTKILAPARNKTVRLLKTTRECLKKGIAKAQPGNRIHGISEAIHSHAIKKGFDVVRDFVGHGVGFKLHEPPKVPNYRDLGINWKLRPGMVIAIEPMLVAGTYEYDVGDNGWTIKTADGKNAAHFEYSVAITEDGPRVLGCSLEEEC